MAVGDPAVKARFRSAAEEEREIYLNCAPRERLDAFSPLGTDPDKLFLVSAPWLIAVLTQSYWIRPDEGRIKHYHATQSMGLATGLLLTAIHHVGLVSLSHTPGPMGFLKEILRRPRNERPFLLLLVGYLAEGVKIPDIQRKQLSEVVTFFE